MENLPSTPAEPVEDRSEEVSQVESSPPLIKERAPSVTNTSAAILWGAVIAVAFLLGLALGFFGRPVVIEDLPIEVVVTVVPNESEPAQADNPSATAADEVATASEAAPAAKPTIMDLVLSDARHFQGDEGAPITIVEFSDFNCGFCNRFAVETLGQLRDEYVDTGKVRFVYKHFAILGPTSTRAAEASECAAEQNSFWDYHDLTFANKAAGRTDLSDESLIAQAADLGLDVGAFSECLESNRYNSQIQQESLSVQSLGVRGTPGFLVNGVFISGAQPFEVFQEVINEQLTSVDTATN